MSDLVLTPVRDLIIELASLEDATRRCRAVAARDGIDWRLAQDLAQLSAREARVIAALRASRG